MPTRLPVRTSAPYAQAQGRQEIFDLSCASIGTAAIGLASFVNWSCHDSTGAVLILLMTGGLVAVLLRGLQRSGLEAAVEDVTKQASPQ